MFEMPAAAHEEVPEEVTLEPQMGYGTCARCRNEGSPNPCYGFVGTGTICQRNWCAHNWADHS